MSVKQKNKKEEKRQRAAQELLDAGVSGYKRYAGQNYFLYILGSLRTSTLYRLFRRGYLIARRLSLITFLLTAGTFLLSVLETGALFLLISAFYLTFFPFFILTAGIAVLFGIMRGSKRRAVLGSCIKEKHVTVFFPVRGVDFSTAYFRANVASLSASDENAVLIVTPYFWSARGLGGHGFFNAYRREGANLYLLRRRFWFSFYKRILKRYASSLVLIY